MKPYSVLADYYDRFSENDCDYRAWSRYLLKIAQRYGARSVVDIACGTGKMTKLLYENGFSVIGVDNSSQMLDAASHKCRATFVRQDMKKLRLTRPTDMAVAVNDAVNYLKPDELAEFFSAVRANLKCGAPFVFDVSSPYKLREVVGNNVFFVDDTDVTLLWTNRLDVPTDGLYDKSRSVRAEGIVTMSLTIFEKQNDAYVRYDEKHRQYIYDFGTLKNVAESCRFEFVGFSADYGKPIEQNSLRLTFCFTAK